MRPILRVTLAVSLLLPWFAGAANAQTSLRWRFTPGERLRVALAQSAATEAEIAGEVFRSRLRVAVELSWRVAEVDAAGAAVIEQTLTHLTVSADLPGAAPVRYDSRAPTNPQASAAAKAVAEEFRPLIGKTTRLRLTAQGEILAAPAARASRAGQGGVALTSGEVRQMLGRLLPRLPPQPAPRDTIWQASLEYPTPQGRVVATGRFAYRGPEVREGRPLEKIEAAYTFQVQAQEPGVAFEFAEPDNAGVFYFDAGAGRLTRGEVHQAMTLRLTVEENQVAQKMTSLTTIEIQPVE